MTEVFAQMEWHEIAITILVLGIVVVKAVYDAIQDDIQCRQDTLKETSNEE